LGIGDWGLGIGDCGLRIADWGLRIADCGLGIADCGLRIDDWGLIGSAALARAVFVARVSPGVATLAIDARHSVAASGLGIGDSAAC
jgi:hypothetical protein